MSQFNAETYWASREQKVFVVSLNNGKKTDRKIVRAKSEQGAVRTAKFHSMLQGRIRAYCRLACPIDLGILQG